MVKAIVGEETQLQLIEDRISKSSTLAQVGLVIGKISLSLDRGFVFDLVPTPNNDAGEPACLIIDPGRDEKKKKGSSSKGKSDSSTLFIDKDWVAEHARQVSRMLVGGIKVVGLFIWVSDTAFKNSTAVVCEVLKSVAEAAPFSETASNERLLIHVCYSPRRWTCRNCTITSNMTSSNLRPCDFKMGKVLGSLQRFRCSYNFNIRLPVSRKSMSHIRILSDALQRGISVIAKELRGAKALVDGNLVVEDETCTSDGFHDVELLLPFMRDTSIEACSLEDIVGVLVFSGSVSSFAFLTSKEPISQAIADIKGDIITSLQSRLDIICDEADANIHPTESTNETSNEKAVSQTDLQSLEKSVQLAFPRRVFAPWLSGTYICDYLQPSETLEVLKEHCSELLSMEVKTEESSCILEPEQEAALLVSKTFWEAVASSPPASSNSSSRDIRADSIQLNRATDFKSTSFSTVAAVLVLLISIIAGCLLFARKS